VCNPILLADHHVTHIEMTEEEDRAAGRAVRHFVKNPNERVPGRVVWCKRCGTEEYYRTQYDAEQAAATHQYVPKDQRLTERSPVTGETVKMIVANLVGQYGVPENE
jgi:hypothetical protein